jgi:hypothetical protein
MAVDGTHPSSQPAVKRVCLALACANFTQGMGGAFVVHRIVPLVARALSASLWQARPLVSVYAAAYATSSPVLVVPAGRHRPDTGALRRVDHAGCRRSGGHAGFPPAMLLLAR